MRKGERIKADIIGPPHKAGASPPCRPWPAHPTRSVFGKPTHKIFIKHLQGFAPTAALRHREERSDPLITELSIAILSVFLNGFDSNCLKMRQMNWSQIVTGCET